MSVNETPKVTTRKLVAEIIKRFKRVSSCSDIRAEYVQIMPLKPKVSGPNWIATIDLPMST
jgi:hypothetical protein